MSLLALLAAAAAFASQPAEPPAAAAPPAAEGEVPVLAAGTQVRLRLLERLTSKNAVQGKRFPIEVVEEVRVLGLVVIPAGTRGVGEVARVIEKGMFGKSGKLRIRPLFVEVAGHRILLEGEARDTGKAGTAPVVIAAPLVGISAGFFSGTSAVMEPGTEMYGYVRDDLPLRVPD